MKESIKKVVELRRLLMMITRPAAGPFGSAAVVVGSVFVGILLSAFITEIQSSPPISWLKAWTVDEEWSWLADWTTPAKWFWSFFVVVALVAVLREYHNHHKAKQDRDELRGNIEGVREVARTMPPKDYLRKSSSEYRRVSFEVESVYHLALVELMALNDEELDNSSITQDLRLLREEINAPIRLVLDAMINLALHFDQPHVSNGTLYSANIMWLKAPGEYPDRHSRDVVWSAAERLSDCENADMFFAAVDQLLVLDVNLATNSRNAGLPDTDILSPLCLAYKHDERGEGYNLPGAPQTLVAGDFSHIPDSREIADTLTQYGINAREKVAHYYATDTRGKSILSMPIAGYDPVTGDENEAIIAVVSVYRNSPGIMQDDQRALMFYHQMTPFLALLYRLCWVRQQLDELEGSALHAYTHLSDQAEATTP